VCVRADGARGTGTAMVFCFVPWPAIGHVIATRSYCCSFVQFFFPADIFSIDRERKTALENTTPSIHKSTHITCVTKIKEKLNHLLLQKSRSENKHATNKVFR
jgi:hypothetical protein